MLWRALADRGCDQGPSDWQPDLAGYGRTYAPSRQAIYVTNWLPTV